MILDTKFPIDPRVSNEANALIKKGHEVYLFCLSYKKKFIKEETINYIKVRRYYCSRLHLILARFVFNAKPQTTQNTKHKTQLCLT